MMARRSSSPGGWVTCCLAFLLKLLAFLQAFAAVSSLLYAAWILSRWARHHNLHLHDLLPDLWFPSAVMAAGLLYSLLLLAGYLAAEINTGCCLCFYTIPAMAMLLLEAALAAHLMLNQHWIQDLPYDRTGELENLLSFIHNNLDLCKWAALAVFATQALSLFLAMILRAMLSARSADYDSDEDFVVIRRPLLVAQTPPPYLPTTVDARGFRPDLWSSRMKQKDAQQPNLKRSGKHQAYQIQFLCCFIWLWSLLTSDMQQGGFSVEFEGSLLSRHLMMILEDRYIPPVCVLLHS